MSPVTPDVPKGTVAYTERSFLIGRLGAELKMSRIRNEGYDNMCSIKRWLMYFYMCFFKPCFPVQYACGASHTYKIADTPFFEHVIYEKSRGFEFVSSVPLCSMPAALRRPQENKVL